MLHPVHEKLVVLDTQFTANILVEGRWGKPTFDRNHIFQMYAYLRSQEDRSPCHASATGVLLFPTVNQRLPEAVELQGHVIRWETIDLNQPWEKIEADLLKIPTAAIGASQGFRAAVAS